MARGPFTFDRVNVVSGMGTIVPKLSITPDAHRHQAKEMYAQPSVGVNYQQYGSLVIDAKASVNEASAVLPDGELKK